MKHTISADDRQNQIFPVTIYQFLELIREPLIHYQSEDSCAHIGLLQSCRLLNGNRILSNLFQLNVVLVSALRSTPNHIPLNSKSRLLLCSMWAHNLETISNGSTYQRIDVCTWEWKEGSIVYEHTSRPSNIKSRSPIIMLSIHLKWLGLDWFGIFKANFYVGLN